MSIFVAKKTLPMDVIRIDGGTQARTKIHDDVVERYAENMRDGDEFPPAVAIFDGKNYWLGDGFHRYHAHRLNNEASMVCNIINGLVRDAILYSYSANGKHGLPLSKKDKHRIVVEIFDDIEWGSLSDREIAKICNVSHTFVAKVRESLGIKTAYKKPKTGNVATSKPKKSTKEPEKAEEKPPVHDEKQEAIEYLVAENEKLSDQLATQGAPNPELATQTIADLREEIKILTIELKSVKISRDQFQSENAQLKKQIASYQRQLKKAA
jgi:FtsZ-binding cell division protein ZapB